MFQMAQFLIQRNFKIYSILKTNYYFKVKQIDDVQNIQVFLIGKILFFTIVDRKN